jgi:hypothetical protein
MTRRRLLVAGLLAIGVLLGVGSAAQATPASSATSIAAVPGIGPDCKGDPPLPAAPSGPLSIRPSGTSTADPFTTEGVSIASAYGTSYRWWAYDNGCGAGSDLMPRFVTSIASAIGLQFPGLLLSIGQGLFTAVIDPSGWIGFLDKPIESATASVAAGVWFPFLSLALLLVAVVTLTRAARGRLSSTITASVWALAVLVVVTWVVGYPTESVKMLDSGIQTAVVTTAEGFGPDGQQVGPRTAATADQSARARAVKAMDGTWDTINRSTVYRSWLQGVFGDADSPTAAKFGPTAFKATHLTWAEYDTYQRDPAGAGKQLVDRKAREFRQVAEQVQAADPLAYQFFTGNMTGDRFGIAVLCLLITLVTTGFFILAGLLTALGYAVARLIVPATPAAGVLFLLDEFRELAVSWGQRIVRVLVMGPLAFLAALVLFAFTNAIFTASMPDGLKYLLITGLSWLAWRLLRPHTAFGRMHMPGKKLLGHVLAMKLAVRAQSAHRRRRGGDDDEDEDGAEDGSDQEQRPSASARGRSDRVVHTPSRTAPAIHHVVVEEDDEPDEEGVVYRRTQSRASAPEVEPVNRRAPGWRSVEVRGAQPDADPVEGHKDAASPALGPRVVSVQSATDDSTKRHMTRRAPFPSDSSPEASPPGGRPLEGDVLAEGARLPKGVHEANLTHDRDGKPVFQVYRPEGSQFYAQDD